ncbi:Uncharacterised protein [Nocardia otitidiscaviarum]|uniref:Rv3651-like N-terminal domain-containing protein n=1 Tax=Nocardia otitidiscaviarum TaxID=1823 RepID=A0A378Y8Z9_9NOCA|nr:GAF domain-containing protein [Nocardia otitidiscaviarum]MBF6238717.1 DUF5593 domain-containing protein [Nocardia otitidiscaviarum]SUA72857.1 Uncharacterised protein [Nocardia otitidiscaviarum]
MVVETLTGIPEQVSLVLNHGQPRSFSKLARASLPEHLVEDLVAECLDTGGNHDKAATDNEDRVYKVAAIPVRGPTSDDIFAIAFWSAGLLEPVPKVPVIGTVEWTPSGLLTTNPAAEYLLRPPNELPDGRTVTELLASFDRWEPRAEFLDMFNFADTPADQWVGTAAKRYEDGTFHQFHITARAVGTGDQRRVRAVICDVSASATSRDTDMAIAALRAVPIPPGHALALVDLKSAFVHEWLAAEHSPLAGWRHHNPLYDRDGRNRVALTCNDLAIGVRDRATITVHVRFTPTDDWIEVTGTWTRIPSDGRPQAILDITPIHPNPPPPISGCGLCYDITHPR